MCDGAAMPCTCVPRACRGDEAAACSNPQPATDLAPHLAGPVVCVGAALQVFACRAAVAAAEAHLQALLPQLASTAGVRALSYVSIQNQGNFLVELPAARTDVPAGWQKVLVLGVTYM